MSPLEAYLSAIHEIRSSGEAVNEISYYSALEILLNEVGKSLKPKVRCVLQIKNRGAGNPDGGLYTEDQYRKRASEDSDIPQNPERGVIEVKPVADDAWITARGAQVSKYWGKYRLVFVTNYRDFVIVGHAAAADPTRREHRGDPTSAENCPGVLCPYSRRNPNQVPCRTPNRSASAGLLKT